MLLLASMKNNAEESERICDEIAKFMTYSHDRVTPVVSESSTTLLGCPGAHLDEDSLVAWGRC